MMACSSSPVFICGNNKHYELLDPMNRTFAIFLFLLPFCGIVISLFINEPVKYKWYHFAILGAGLFVTIINVYTSWIRPIIYKIRYGSYDGYKFVSGFPIVGTVIGIAALVLCGSNWLTIFAVLVIFTLDTGGLPWSIFSTWNDRSLWTRANRLHNQANEPEVKS